MCEGSPAEQAHAQALYERVLEALPDDREAAQRLDRALPAVERLDQAAGRLASPDPDRSGRKRVRPSLLLELEKSAIEAGAADEYVALLDHVLARSRPESKESARALKRARARVLGADAVATGRGLARVPRARRGHGARGGRPRFRVVHRVEGQRARAAPGSAMAVRMASRARSAARQGAPRLGPRGGRVRRGRGGDRGLPAPGGHRSRSQGGARGALPAAPARRRLRGRPGGPAIAARHGERDRAPGRHPPDGPAPPRGDGPPGRGRAGAGAALRRRAAHRGGPADDAADARGPRGARPRSSSASSSSRAKRTPRRACASTSSS